MMIFGMTWVYLVIWSSSSLLPSIGQEHFSTGGHGETIVEFNHNFRDENFKKFRDCMEESGTNEKLIVDLKSDPDRYEKLNQQWNLRKTKVFPIAHFVPKLTTDVQHAVKCGRKAKIHLIPKSGGHSYESHSDGSNDTIVIDFQKMDHINIDHAGEIKTADIGPGALVGQVNVVLWRNGKYAIPFGNCLTVGIGGTTLGGGFGYFSHVYGLAQDKVLEYTFVDAEGDVKLVSRDQHSNLFWALRGGGSGYLGIITNFKFKLIDASKMKITLARVIYPITASKDVLGYWEKWVLWVKENEPQIFSVMFVGGNGDLFPNIHGFDIQGVHIQDENLQPHGNGTFIQTFNKIFKGGQIMVIPIPYLTFILLTGYAPLVGVPAKGPYPEDLMLHLREYTPTPRYFKQKSFYVKKTGENMDEVAQVLLRFPENYAWLLYASEGGAIHDINKHATAYIHRNALYSISVQYEGSPSPQDVEEGMSWFQEFWKSIQFLDSGETYQNYVDDDLKNPFQRYYGSNLPRLISTKREWDPKNYFQQPASLPVNHF